MFFLVKENIIQYYLDYKSSPCFLVKFNSKVGTLVKTLSARNTIDYLRLLEELNIIAEEVKGREMSTRQYLSIILKYVESVTEGIHKNMEFDRETLECRKLPKSQRQRGVNRSGTDNTNKKIYS